MKTKIKAVLSVITIGITLLCAGCVDKENGSSSSSTSSSSSSSGSSSISSAAKIGDILNLDHQEDMAVTFYYDVEEPDVIFIAPDGAEIFSGELPSDRDDGAVCYYIDGAVPGQWRIKYDKKSNSKLEANWAPQSSTVPRMPCLV